MKIAIYTPFPPNFGGGERYCFTIAETLGANNEVEFISSFDYSLENFSKAFNLNLKKVKFIRKISTEQFFLPQIRKKHDLFICLSNHIIPPVFSWGRKGILIIQFPFPHPRGKIGNKVQFLLKNLKYSSYDLIICYSKFSKKWIQRLAPSSKKIVILSPPVDTSYFISTSRKRNKILSVGRFFQTDHEKKYLEMMGVFKEILKKDIIKWTYHIAGGVSDKTYFEELNKKVFKSQIFLHPNISAEGLKNLYEDAKIFWHAAGLSNSETLTPWKSEHFGMVVLEAMSAKCVPIVARKGALPEFVKHGQNGFLFDNLKELENWTLKLMKNEELREEMGRKAVLTAKKFDKEIFRKRLLRIIKKLMK